jgi:hypothetical protein
MISIARTLGAPLTVPEKNAALEFLSDYDNRRPMLTDRSRKPTYEVHPSMF